MGPRFQKTWILVDFRRFAELNFILDCMIQMLRLILRQIARTLRSRAEIRCESRIVLSFHTIERIFLPFGDRHA